MCHFYRYREHIRGGGVSLLYIYREHIRSGGVSLHVHNRLAGIERKDLSDMSECMESCCVEIDKEKTGLDKKCGNRGNL